MADCDCVAWCRGSAIWAMVIIVPARADAAIRDDAA
jgi:hypothetical protein